MLPLIKPETLQTFYNETNDRKLLLRVHGALGNKHEREEFRWTHICQVLSLNVEESSFSGPAALLLLKNKTTLALWRWLRYHGDRGEPTRNKKGERENRPASTRRLSTALLKPIILLWHLFRVVQIWQIMMMIYD